MIETAMGIGPTVDKLYQRKHRSTAICPRCAITENNKHVHQCKTDSMDQIFENALEGLKDYYMEGHCPSEMVKAISMLIRSARL